MTKQNFISMSLESGLKYVDLLCEPDDNICTLKGILNGFYCDDHGNVDCEINDCMPILRPLDLTKEIEHGGERFVPIRRLVPESFGHIQNVEISDFLDRGVAIISNLDTDEQLHIYTDNGISISTRNHSFNVSDFRIINLLISWHFDIADLISKNQAIDINTLETNPYK